MSYYGGWGHTPTDLMEHIAHLKQYYYADDEVREKLFKVAKYLDNPVKLKELEEEWLYGIKAKGKKKDGEYGYSLLAKHFGWD